MRISDWSSDVCSSDLLPVRESRPRRPLRQPERRPLEDATAQPARGDSTRYRQRTSETGRRECGRAAFPPIERSEEHTSELQSLMRISYAVFCLKKKNKKHRTYNLYKLYTNQHI